jgi:hypothetical protein
MQRYLLFFIVFIAPAVAAKGQVYDSKNQRLHNNISCQSQPAHSKQPAPLAEGINSAPRNPKSGY